MSVLRFAVLLVSSLLTACAPVQMGYNVLSYDETVAETANQLLLLNAVRASQHYPMSFTSVGPVVAGPPLSGSLGSTLNFSSISGLQTYNLNPAISASAGYSQFALGNLNTTGFMEAVRKSVNSKITEAFNSDPRWPHELVDLIYVQTYKPSKQLVGSVDSRRKFKCAAPANTFTRSLCEKLNEHIETFTSRCGDDHFKRISARLSEFRDDPLMYYNSVANYCHFERFRIFREELALLKLHRCPPKTHVGCVPATIRSASAMIGYLGELIAAQNYIDEPFTPLVMVGISVGTKFHFEDAPLFIVQRGAPLGLAAIAVEHEGATYYIPKPDYGSPTEARSLQTLDLVLQTVQAAMHRDDLPKTLPSFAVIPAKS